MLLLLFLVVLLILVLILLLLVFILVFIVVVLLIVAATLVLLVLVLLLFQMLTEHEVIACLVVVGIQTEGILISLDGLAILLMRLTNHTNIMESLSLSQGITLQACSILELFHSCRVFLLCHQGIAQVKGCLRILIVLLHSLTIRHLGIGVITCMELFVTLADILAIGGLRPCGTKGEKNNE